MAQIFRFNATQVRPGEGRAFEDQTVVEIGLPASAGVLEAVNENAVTNPWPNPVPVGSDGYESTDELWPMSGEGPLVFVRSADTPTATICEFRILDPAGGLLAWSPTLFPATLGEQLVDGTVHTGYDFLAFEAVGPEGAMAELTVKQYDADEVLLATTVSAPVAIDDEYMRLEAYWEPELGCAFVEPIVRIFLDSGVTEGDETVSIEHFSWGEYMDGDTLGYVWEGEPDRSRTLEGMLATGLSITSNTRTYLPVEGGIHAGVVLLESTSPAGAKCEIAAESVDGDLFRSAAVSLQLVGGAPLQCLVQAALSEVDLSAPEEMAFLAIAQAYLPHPAGGVNFVAFSLAPGDGALRVWINDAAAADIPLLDEDTNPTTAPQWADSFTQATLEVGFATAVRLVEVMSWDDIESDDPIDHTEASSRLFQWTPGPNGGERISGYLVSSNGREVQTPIPLGEVPGDATFISVQAINSKGRSTPEEVTL